MLDTSEVFIMITNQLTYLFALNVMMGKIEILLIIIAGITFGMLSFRIFRFMLDVTYFFYTGLGGLVKYHKRDLLVAILLYLLYANKRIIIHFDDFELM